MMINQPIDKTNATIVNALKKVGISSEEATNGALIIYINCICRPLGARACSSRLQH